LALSHSYNLGNGLSELKGNYSSGEVAILILMLFVPLIDLVKDYFILLHAETALI